MSGCSEKLKYLVNPNVVLREEDENGALIFNPDSNQVKVINTTGLYIWKACETPKNLQEILEAVHRSFDQIPGETASADIAQYLDQMITGGFMLTVES